MQPLTVLLADDSLAVREGYRYLLQGDSGIVIVGEARNGEAAVTLANELAPAVILMDMDLPLLDGVAATKQILGALPRTTVVMLAETLDDAQVRRARSAGAAGCLAKHTTAEALSQAIREAAAGRSRLPSLGGHAEQRGEPKLDRGAQSQLPEDSSAMPEARASEAPRPATPPPPPGIRRIVVIENNPSDIDAMDRALRDAGLAFSRAAVTSRDAFEAELKDQPPDLILSNYSIPGFDGPQALAIAKAMAPEIPFIFVTGVLGEEVGIELLKQGATDCVLKTHLARLGPSALRALHEARERREREHTEEKLISSHDQLRALTNHLQSVREEERTRIARQVHDELGQALTCLKLDLSWLARKTPGARGVQRKIKQMSADIDATIATVRGIATELRPGVLDSLGLAAAIEWQSGDFQQRTGIPCKVSIDAIEPPPDPGLSTVFFRIFQEILTNIIRHAKATQVEVRVKQAEGFLVLTVRDHGRGISEHEINSRAIGLVGMKERISQVGGEIFFFGLPSQGTTVTVRVPLAASATAAAKE